MGGDRNLGLWHIDIFKNINLQEITLERSVNRKEDEKQSVCSHLLEIGGKGKSQQRRMRKNGQSIKGEEKDCDGLETKCKTYIKEKVGTHCVKMLLYSDQIGE